jgi:hypothetical protein
MSAPAAELYTYVWHYLIARLLYDELLRPLTHGRLSSVLIVAGCIVAAALLFARRRRTR